MFTIIFYVFSPWLSLNYLYGYLFIVSGSSNLSIVIYRHRQLSLFHLKIQKVVFALKILT